MTTLVEKIAVMQAFARGEKIEFYTYDGWKLWVEPHEPFWSWISYDYRIAKPESKKIKLLAWFDTVTLRLQWLGEGSPVSGDWERVPSEDKEIALP